MAKQALGPLGNASGKIAHLVYFKKDNNGFVRLAPQKKADPSAAQMEINAKFALMQGFLGKVSGYIAKGFESKDSKLSAYNEAFRLNLKQAITGTMPDYQIDFEQIQLTNGKLLKPSTFQAQAVDGTMNITWHYNTTASNESGDDKMSIVVFNPTKGIALQYDRIADRSEVAASVVLPPDFTGDEVLTWACFQNVKGDQVSSSSFVRVQF